MANFSKHNGGNWRRLSTRFSPVIINVTCIKVVDTDVRIDRKDIDTCNIDELLVECGWIDEHMRYRLTEAIKLAPSLWAKDDITKGAMK